MIYFTSDLHFNHASIIKMCERPFSDVSQMNETLITNWNSCVQDADEIYILGDFIFNKDGKQANDIVSRLKGKKYLIRGNHEKYLNSVDFETSAFEWIKDYYVLNYKDARFVLFHYPIWEWEHYHRKSVHLYGHIHNHKKIIPDSINFDFGIFSKRAINVCVDVNDFFPVSAELIYARAFK